MKINDLRQMNYDECKESSYLVCNAIREDNEENFIDKNLVPVKEFASKNEVNVLVEQNSKLVEIISSFVNRLQTIELELGNIKNSLSKTTESSDVNKITEMLNDISKRLDDNLIEI